MSLLSLLPIFIIFVGTYLLFKVKFFFIIHPKRTLKFAFSGENTKKSIFSLMLALAGTLGVGNIAGVAVGIYVGGAGSVFWLLISAFFSSAIKYAEVYLSHSSNDGYGMIGVIEKSFGNFGKSLSRTYALLAVVLAFFMGAVFQARAISDSAENTHGAFVNIFALPLIIFTVAICVLGKKRIKRAVAFIIPFAAILYTVMCLIIIFSEFKNLLPTVCKVISSAFSTKSATGGILGFITASGMKEGFARGLLSNEAGAGTSSFSHTSHIEENTSEGLDCANFQKAGIFGILEVVFDTLFLCPLTAFAILLGTDANSFGGTLEELSLIFEKYLGGSAPLLLLVSITAFAISTVLCWYYYGKVSLRYLFGKRGGILYSLIFFGLFAAGLLYEVPHVLFITDTTLFFLSVISLSALIKNRALLRWDAKALKKANITNGKFN